MERKKRRSLTIIVVAVSVLSVVLCCSGYKEQSALYVLEELEAASSVVDPSDRVKRLEIFIGNHSRSSYRALGHRRIFEALAEDLGDLGRARNYLEGVLAKESDQAVRGSLLHREFAYLWKSDREKALSLAESLLEGEERYFRLFLYMGYYMGDEDGRMELAERCFLKARSLASDSFERSLAMAELGSLLEREGRSDEALDILKQAGGNIHANEALGRILWDMGRREEAIEVYLRLAAVVPDARKDVGLDSLYAIVYPNSSDLEEKVFDARMKDEGVIPEQGFVDIEGKRHNLKDYRGSNLVVNIWNPT